MGFGVNLSASKDTFVDDSEFIAFVFPFFFVSFSCFSITTENLRILLGPKIWQWLLPTQILPVSPWLTEHIYLSFDQTSIFHSARRWFGDVYRIPSGITARFRGRLSLESESFQSPGIAQSSEGDRSEAR